LRLAEALRYRIRLGRIEETIPVLDEFMRLLEMPRNICIAGIDQLIGLIADVSRKLQELDDQQSEWLLLEAALMLQARSKGAAPEKPDFLPHQHKGLPYPEG
jgi:hypothetical protein